MCENPANLNNPIVFLDIRIGKEDVGRIIIELRKDVCPITCENFRALCTGEKGSCYRGTVFHKVVKLCHAQGGDVKNLNGKYFDDENFFLKHEPGAVSMANYGEPNTNSSQFVIASVECYHLDGDNVVFGRVLRGLSIVNEMENAATDDGKTTRAIVISNCGEIKPGKSWGYCDDDETADKLPPYPMDWDKFYCEISQKEKLETLVIIKNSGNHFHRAGDFAKSARKYKKLTRYYNLFKDHVTDDEEEKALDSFQLINLTNLAATQLKLGEFNDVRSSCNAAIKIDQNNSKAFYRRGVANLELKNYELALDDLKMAHKLKPGNKTVLKEFDRAKKYLMDYRVVEKKKFKKMFC